MSRLNLTAILILTLPVSAFAGTETPAGIDTARTLLPDSLAPAGTVVYTDFWASWCVPCRKSLPWLGRLLDRHGTRGLRVVTINLDKDRKAADEFLASLTASLPVVYDPGGEYAKRYALEVMPTSVIYGRDGILRRRHEGFSPADTLALEALVDSLLNEEPKR